MKRPDGRRIRTSWPEYQVGMNIMSERTDALNMIELDIRYDPVQDYINKKRKEGYRISHMAVVIAVYIRTLCEFPYMNRFIVNRRMYARNEVAVGMTVLKPGDAEGTMDKMRFPRESTIFDVQRIMDECIERNRKPGDNSETDYMVTKLMSIPGLCRVGVRLLKWMDKHNIMPKKVVEISPFHCTMSVTNLASIKTNFIFHHVYNFGTTSMMLAMGNTKYIPVKRKGEIVIEKHIPIGVVMDERIASGYTFALSFDRMQQYFKNPELLELPPEKIIEDVP